MVDAGRCTRLPPETLPLLTIAKARANPLDGDGPVQALIVRRIHDAHTTFSELAHDAIATKRFQRASLPVDRTLQSETTAVSLPHATAILCTRRCLR